MLNGQIVASCKLTHQVADFFVGRRKGRRFLSGEEKRASWSHVLGAFPGGRGDCLLFNPGCGAFV